MGWGEPQEVRQPIGRLQRDVGEWHNRRWGDKDLERRVLKLGEECGEVQGAFVKYHEGRRTEQDFIEECADMVVVLYAIAAKAGFDLDEAVRRRFYADVRHR